jgi:hypothetical protein
MPETAGIQPRTFKTMARGMVFGLVIVVGLVTYNISIPKGRSSSKNWNFVLTHPTILLHIIFGTLVLLGSIVLLIQSARSRVRSWILISAIGMAFVIFAFVMGEQYVSDLSNSELSDMSLGWFAAIATYGVGWYLYRHASSSTDAT